jgi:hypothetical protein
MASAQVSSRPTLEIPFSCDGKSNNILRQIEEFAAGSYTEFKTCGVPCGWTNDPAYLDADTCFTDKKNSTKTMLKTDYNIPNARPILNDRMYLYLLDGGDGKYYLWNGVSGDVVRIEESSLQEIVGKLGNEGLSGLKLTLLTEE